MARPSLKTHPKYKTLIHLLRSLNVNEAQARGHLELLWEAAYESGDAVIGDDMVVEATASRHGEPGKLVHALSVCGGADRAGFIERRPDGRWAVHDLFDHCPDYVKKRASRESERRARNARTGLSPVEGRLSANDVDATAAVGRRRPVSDRSSADNGGQSAVIDLVSAGSGAPPGSQHPAPTPTPTLLMRPSGAAAADPTPEV